MNLKKRRSKEKEEMKNLILKASIEIINKDGFDKLSMRKIAHLIDYSPTTIYIYYENKAQIAEDIGMKIYDKIIEDVTEMLSKHPELTIEDKIKKSFYQFIISMTDDPEMGKAFIKSGSDTMFKANPDEQSGENLLQSFLVEGNSLGVIREVDSNSSWMLLTALIGFGMCAIENQFYLLDNWDELIKSFVSILMHGIILEDKKENES